MRVVNALYPPGAQAEGGAGVKLVADERTNSVLVSGERAARLRLKALVTHLDTPLEAGGETQVRYLRYADAEKIAAKLKEQATATAAVTGGAPPQGGAAGGAAQIDKNTTIWADPETNALIITAPPKIMRSLTQIIDKLDLRREQVEVEAIIVDVSSTKAAELGVNWAVDGSGDNFAVGGFISPIGGTTIIDIARGIDDPSTFTAPPIGLTIGGGRISETATSFAAILKALRSDTDSNIIATPHIVTMDNQEAQIKDAREVPFITGQFTNTGASQGQVTPFQTIQRQEVGTILKITPQISEGNTIRLKIEQESSDIAGRVAGAVNVVTVKRTISTNVLVEDGSILVLGGLIRDRVSGSEQRVPFLGKIPLLGNLFKTRESTKEKTTLMVFIKPRILRTAEQTAIETNQKYEHIRDQQRSMNKGKAPLLPNEKQPVLPPLPPANINPTPFDSPTSTKPTPAPAPITQGAPVTQGAPTTPPAGTEPPADAAPAPTPPEPQTPNPRRPPQSELGNQQPRPSPTMPPES